MSIKEKQLFENTFPQLALVLFVMGSVLIIEVGEKSIVTSVVVVHLFFTD